MAKEKERRNALDPAVESALGGDPLYGRMAKERKMTAAQRKRATEDRKRTRMNLDISDELKGLVEVIAEAEGLTNSQVVSWLLAIGLEHFDRSAMIDAKVPSKSMRWEFLLEVPEVELPEAYRE